MSPDKDDYQFECKVCKKVFSNSLNFVKHLNDHVVKENIKFTECHDEPFCCKTCGTFTSVNDDDISKRRGIVLKKWKNLLMTLIYT